MPTSRHCAGRSMSVPCANARRTHHHVQCVASIHAPASSLIKRRLLARFHLEIQLARPALAWTRFHVSSFICCGSSAPYVYSIPLCFLASFDHSSDILENWKLLRFGAGIKPRCKPSSQCASNGSVSAIRILPNQPIARWSCYRKCGSARFTAKGDLLHGHRLLPVSA